MAQVQCRQGHFYDKARYSNCPFCPVPDLNTDPEPSRPKDARGPAEGAQPRSPSDAAPKAGFGTHPKTRMVWARKSGATEGGDPERDPVVGWLVAIQGPAQGRDFRIRWGNNRIGSDPSLEIFVSQDPEIHHRPHAFIVYSPVTNTYHLRPGDERGLVHVRDPRMHEEKWELVQAPIQLTPYEIIRLGGSQFMFVPLCGDDFEWA